MRWSWRLVAGLVGLVLFTIALINLVVVSVVLGLFETWVWVLLVLGVVLLMFPALSVLWGMTSPSARELERQRADLYEEREKLIKEVEKLRFEAAEAQERSDPSGSKW